MATRLMYPTYTIGGWTGNVIDDAGASWAVKASTLPRGPSAKTNTTSKPHGAGSFRVDSFLDSRSVVLSGTCIAADARGADAARRSLVSQFYGGSQVTLSVDSGFWVREMTVELADAGVDIEFVGNSYTFDWQLSLFAADSPLYGPKQSASTGLPTSAGVGLNWANPTGLSWANPVGLNWGSAVSTGAVSMLNAGDVDTWPVFTLNGPLTQPVITNGATGERIAFSGTLATADDDLVIDTSPFRRSVMLNGGTEYRSQLGFVSWFPIGPGQTLNAQLTAASGSGTLSATWRSAYN